MCVNAACSSCVPLLFILHLIAFGADTRSHPVHSAWVEIAKFNFLKRRIQPPLQRETLNRHKNEQGNNSARAIKKLFGVDVHLDNGNCTCVKKFNRRFWLVGFCSPNSDHVLLSREFASCLFISCVRIRTWIWRHTHVDSAIFERNNSLG